MAIELGNESNDEHTRVVKLLSDLNFADVVLVGGEFSKVASQYRAFVTTADLIEFLKESNIIGKTILIKGSRGIALEQTIAYLN